MAVRGRMNNTFSFDIWGVVAIGVARKKVKMPNKISAIPPQQTSK